MISDTQRQQLLRLMQTPEWQTIESMAEQLKSTIREEEIETDTEWEFVKKSLARDYQTKGIDRFFKELYKEASHG